MHRILMALTAALVFLPGLAPAQITEISVRVDGLSCPFCAYSLEKELKAVAGVAKLTIDVAEGVARITPQDKTRVDFAALPAAVEKAGFTPREISATGVGRITAVDSQAVLVDLDGTTLFRLEANEVLENLTADRSLTFDFTGTVLPGATEQQPGTDSLALTAATVRPNGKDG